MPSKKTAHKAAQDDKRAGKSSSTQAGEYVREEIEELQAGEGPAKSRKQAIAIGLSRARRDGVAARPGKRASSKVKRKAGQDLAAGRGHAAKKTAKKATKKATKKTAKKAAKKATKKTAKKAAKKATKKAAKKTTSRGAKKAAKKTAGKATKRTTKSAKKSSGGKSR
ncbi:DNA-binding protein [Pseudoxanthomonas sp. X-1]|uniref:DNA-binding protein n=1 Tax=Pseudoxanthomonas sp. X-1 TaxID=2571115 RepID=UPI00110B0131|nr:DNA-binding protein [Pseudoxanthomonas sp. X-1]TMN25473.1 DNA-binding protein [Pseudoxanthomonas sp. X-1]UAY76324.1 DNA-binding protein [Pseudoxanthomonas sp. X-1]